MFKDFDDIEARREEFREIGWFQDLVERSLGVDPNNSKKTTHYVFKDFKNIEKIDEVPLNDLSSLQDVAMHITYIKKVY